MRPRKAALPLTLLLVVLTQVSGPSGGWPPHVEVLWRFDAGGCLTHTPAVVDGMLYVASGNGVLGQLERDTGKLRWMALMGGSPTACMFRGTLAPAAGMVLAAASSTIPGSGSLRAIDRTTGHQRWAQSAGRGLAPSVSYQGGLAFVPTIDGQLMCLNANSGEREWTVPLTVGDWGSPVVTIDRLFVGAADGWVYALSTTTGLVQWRTNLGAPITTAVRRGEKALFVGTRDGRIHRVDMANGRILASRRLDTRLAPRSAPLVGADVLFVQLGDENGVHQALVAVDRTLNRVRWRVTATNAWSTTRVFAWKNTVTVGTAFGDVLAYCAADGAPAWTHKIEGTIRTLSGSEDTLFVGTTEGVVEAIRPPSVCGTAS